ncbi:hypothetical protein [Caulobacter hibisci]|uniref:Uncharacterized protein n=1 Tax=Caulobacter hibisci TaxID=2035993 RepID=A0ABS0T547_9CAUL|nr:hypothetical protein [Caulobacter hibisci]MBI1687011.1 hypothetical protein [Caulobacter hibisci]
MALSRRSVLLGAGVSTLALGGGAWAFVTSHREEDLVLSVLHRLVGPFEMSRENLTALTQEVKLPAPLKSSVLATVEQLGGAGALKKASSGANESIVDIERRALTEFITKTDYLRREAPSDPVLYKGFQSCTNPYAKFDFS